MCLCVWLVDDARAAAYSASVTTQEIIDQIKRLSPGEQAEVVRFAYQLDAERQLSGGELSALAQRLAQTNNPSEAMLVREAIHRGFYGGK